MADNSSPPPVVETANGPRALSILRQTPPTGDAVVDDSRHSIRHLDLKHLRQLTEVADKGSIRAAAESLAITQPALSRSIRSI
ncbi:MAG TPA: LysR family transcriptional regulator, partial [Gammaproteobacteria bacterium]|nr:LysR family transcriptional regulator [Gammaproteobacteria bacterium]